MSVSNCCGADYSLEEDGTGFTCDDCGNPCDIMPLKEWREEQRLLLEAEGGAEFEQELEKADVNYKYMKGE